MSLLGSWRGMQTHQGVLVAATGMLNSLVLLAADSSEQGFLSAGILWIAGAIGLAVGHGLFSLAAAVALLGLAHVIFSRGGI